MAFEYKPFINPYIGSISELMGKGDQAKAEALLRIGEIQARAAEQQGQAWGNAIQGLGNIASKTITDYNDPKLRMQKIELAKAEEQERLRQASKDLSSQTIPSVISTNVPGQPFEAPTVNVIPPTQRGIGSRAFENVGFGVPVRPAAPQSVFGTAAIGKTMVTPDSTVVESAGPNVSRFVDQSTKMLDVKGFQNALAQLTDPKTGQSFSLESIAARLKPLIDVNESLIDYDAKKSALDKSQQVGFGTLANSILTYVDQNPGSRIIDIASVAAAAWGDRLGSDKIAAFIQDLKTLSPSQQQAKLEGLKSTAEAQMPTDNLAQGAKKVGAFGTILGQGDPKDTPLPTRASLLAAANNPDLSQVERAAAQKAADGYITETPAQSTPRRVRITWPDGTKTDRTADYVPGKGQSGRYFLGDRDITSLDPQLIDDPSAGLVSYSPVSTAEGIFPFNNRTGLIGARVADLRPGDAAGSQIADARTTLELIGDIEKNFTPDKVGPLAGRFKTLEAGILGLDPEYAELAAQVTELRNTTINLLTGKQMSGPEAQRIFSQLPGLNLPFDTFLARLRTSKNYFERFLKNKEDVAYGRPAQPVAGPTDNTKIYYDKDGNPILVPKK